MGRLKWGFFAGGSSALVVGLLGVLGPGCSSPKAAEEVLLSGRATDATTLPEASSTDAGAPDGSTPYPLNQICGAPPDAGADAPAEAADAAGDADPDAADASVDAGLDGGDAGDSGVDSGHDAGFDPCERCSLDLCCNTHAAVFGTEAGNELAGCMDACWAQTGKIAPCQATCFDRFPGTAQVFRDQSACVKNRCPACGTSDEKCYACFHTRCAREELACDLDRDCFLVAACSLDCGYTEACVKSCAEAYPKARPFLAAIDACTTERCGSECAP